MTSTFRDLRQSLRIFRRKRGFVSLVVLTLGLGIGVTTAVFSVFHGVLLQPLPYPEPERLVRVYDVQPSCDTCPASFPKYHDWRDRNRVFSDIGGSTPASFTLSGNGLPSRVDGMRTTASLADVLRVPPRIGRWYTDEEDRAGGPKVVVLSHDFWAGQMSGDPAILGKNLILDGEPYEIIGVMPHDFSHRRAEIYVPLQRELDPATRGSHFLAVFARLADGISVDRAASEMKVLGESLIEEFGGNHGIDVKSYHESIVGNVRAPLRILLGATFILLLIASTNVTNLLLAAGIERKHDLAIRLVMGGSRRALARQLLAEGLVLALAGGVAGVMIAYGLVHSLRLLVADFLPRAATISIDASVLIFSFGTSILVGLICSIWPMIFVLRGNLSLIVREDGSRAGRSSGKRLRSALVVAEIALSFVLIVGAGLMAKDLMLLQSRQTGFRTDRIVTFDLAPSGPRYEAPEAYAAFYRDVYERLSRVDTIESVGLTSHLPMLRFGYNGEFQIEGNAPWSADEAPLVEYRWYCGDYFEALGVPLLKGRLLGEQDGSETRTVLINRTMAEQFWPGADPIGKRFGQGDDASTWFQVVGVVGDIRSRGTTLSAPPEFYRLTEQSAFPYMSVVIRTKGEDSLAIISTAREIISSIDPTVPVSSVETLESIVSQSVGRPRLFAVLSVSFAVLAGLLAIVGIYGVIDYSVRRQRRDFGIRMAIGASPSSVRSHVLAHGMRLATGGIAIGLAGSWGMGRFIRSILFDARPADPLVLGVTGVLLAVVAIASAYLPAREATKVDPSIVLRDA